MKIMNDIDITKEVLKQLIDEMFLLDAELLKKRKGIISPVVSISLETKELVPTGLKIKDEEELIKETENKELEEEEEKRKELIEEAKLLGISNPEDIDVKILEKLIEKKKGLIKQ